MAFGVEAFTAAVARAERELPATGLPRPGSRLAWAAAQVLGGQGAGIIWWAVDGVGLPWGASSSDAATAEQAQATTGQGPCIDAFTGGTAVMGSAAVIDRFWPGFAAHLTEQTRYRSVVAAPIDGVGALDVYFTDPDGCLAVNVGAAAEVSAHILAAARRDPALTGVEELIAVERSTQSRRANVSIATGILAVRLSVDLSAALAVLRARAFADSRTIDDVATDLVNGVPVPGLPGHPQPDPSP